MSTEMDRLLPTRSFFLSWGTRSTPIKKGYHLSLTGRLHVKYLDVKLKFEQERWEVAVAKLESLSGGSGVHVAQHIQVLAGILESPLSAPSRNVIVGGEKPDF